MRKLISKKYKFAAIAVDLIIFTIFQKKLQVVLIQMKKKPFQNYWALPGGLIKPNESLEQAAKRHLSAKSGMQNIYLEQLYTFGEIDRDPFGRVVSAAYFALIPNVNLKLKTSKRYNGISWFPVEQLPPLAYDHRTMIEFALKRLKAKVGYTNIIYSLMPNIFTLGTLQQSYEIILNKKLDKRNFRKKIMALDILKKTNEKTDLSHRPATLYQFKKRESQIINML